MNLYVDKENLLSLVRQMKQYPDADVVDDCLRMIKKQLHLVYNFKKDEISEQLYQLWFNTLVQGRGTKEESDVSCTPPFPHRPMEESCYEDSNWETISSTYLCTDEKTDEICNQQTILLSRKEQEIQTLSKLLWGDYSYSKKYSLSDGELSYGWKELERDGHCLPCTDILLVDRYLLADPRNFRNNLFPLIQCLTKHVKAPVNLIVFVERTLKYPQKRPYSSSDYLQFVQQLSNIRKGNAFPLNVTIVVYPPSMEGGRSSQKTVPHSRFLLTNYRLFLSDPSFGSYFDKDHKLSTNGMYLTVESLADSENYQQAQGWIALFQGILDQIYDLPDHTEFIFGDRKSNILKFQ